MEELEMHSLPGQNEHFESNSSGFISDDSVILLAFSNSRQQCPPIFAPKSNAILLAARMILSFPLTYMAGYGKDEKSTSFKSNEFSSDWNRPFEIERSFEVFVFSGDEISLFFTIVVVDTQFEL